MTEATGSLLQKAGLGTSDLANLIFTSWKQMSHSTIHGAHVYCRNFTEGVTTSYLAATKRLNLQFESTNVPSDHIKAFVNRHIGNITLLQH